MATNASAATHFDALMMPCYAITHMRCHAIADDYMMLAISHFSLLLSADIFAIATPLC